MVATTDRLLKGVLRQGAFAASVAGLLLRPSPVFGVRWPGGACRRTVQVVFSNGPLYGGGFRVSPAACPFDGRLDMAVFRYRGHFARAFQIAAAMLRGHGKSLFFKRVRVNRAVVLGKHLPAHVDGEPVRVSDVRVSLRPGALWVLGGPHVHGSAVVRGL